MTRVKTPMEDKPVARAGDEEAGERSGDCRTHVGAILFVARGTRNDVLVVVLVLGRAVKKWLRRHDRALHRLYSYLWCTREAGQNMRVNPVDLDSFLAVLYFDADFCGPDDTARCASGYCFFLRGRFTNALLDGISKLQTSQSVSTPEGEIVAGAAGMMRCAFPLRTMSEDILGRRVEMVALTDNSTALQDLLQGSSKTMKHLRRQHKVSISLLSEIFQKTGHVLDKVDTGDNTSDILTKALGPEVHLKHTRGLTLGILYLKGVLAASGAMTAKAFWANMGSKMAGLANDRDFMEFAADQINELFVVVLSQLCDEVLGQGEELCTAVSTLGGAW